MNDKKRVFKDLITNVEKTHFGTNNVIQNLLW